MTATATPTVTDVDALRMIVDELQAKLDQAKARHHEAAERYELLFHARQLMNDGTHTAAEKGQQTRRVNAASNDLDAVRAGVRELQAELDEAAANLDDALTATGDEVEFQTVAMYEAAEAELDQYEAAENEFFLSEAPAPAPVPAEADQAPAAAQPPMVPPIYRDQASLDPALDVCPDLDTQPAQEAPAGTTVWGKTYRTRAELTSRRAELIVENQLQHGGSAEVRAELTAINDALLDWSDSLAAPVTDPDDPAPARLDPGTLGRIERGARAGWAVSSAEAVALCTEIRRLQAELARAAGEVQAA